jgi:protein SCO1/2
MTRTNALATLVSLVALTAAVAGCGSSSPPAKHRSTATTPGKLQAPAQLNPPKPAPNFRLRDSLGRTVSLSQFRGKAVLLTFIYDHCPDVCPLIVSHFHTALTQLGANARHVQVVAVSVDPRGDTPKTVKAFLAQHLMTGRMEYLIGSRKELAPVWRKWGVAVKSTPDAREVDHSAFVYGITAGGYVKALYPSNFKPGWITHDVPILGAS